MEKFRSIGKLLTFDQDTKKEAKKIILTIGAFQWRVWRADYTAKYLETS